MAEKSTESAERGEPPPLGYSQVPFGSERASTWPVRLYVAALLWAFVTVYVIAPPPYSDERWPRLRTQLALLGCAAARLVWAQRKREQGRGWVFYVAVLFLAMPIWLLIAPPLSTIGRRVWGVPLIP
jgi:hypothetical protein